MVSIIMHAHNSAKFAEQSVRSVIAQTYQNWELLFVDNSSNDGTLNIVSRLKSKDPRIMLSQYPIIQEAPTARLSALRNARGRWVAFMECGDLWESNKLECQIAFMEENDYLFSYTKYKMLRKKGKGERFVMGGKETVTYDDMLRCCWPGYLTVMYDKNKIGDISLGQLKEENGYAMWLAVSKQTDCHLLDECLASQRQNVRLLNPFPLTEKMSWRYMVYRAVEKRGRLVSILMMLRCLWYGLVKRVKYVEKAA